LKGALASREASVTPAATIEGLESNAPSGANKTTASRWHFRELKQGTPIWR